MELLELKLQKAITTELFTQKNTALEKQIQTIEKVEACKAEQIQEIREALLFLEKLQEKFKDAESNHKKAVVKKLVLNPSLYERELHGQAKERYLALLSMRKHLKGGIEPPKNPSSKGLTECQQSCCTAWWGIVNEFGTF